MDNTQTQQPIDQTALALSRSIRKAEGGNYSDMSGDAGTSAGAYQFNNGKILLKKGEIPANFKSWATEFKLDPNDFSETNQDHVAYLKIKKDLDAGLSQSQIAAKWNSGLTTGWENHVGDVVINGKTIHYDTPSYVNKVKEEYLKQMGEMKSGTSIKDSTNQQHKTISESLKDILKTQAETPNLKATTGIPTLDAVKNLTPGGTLAQGLGYGIAAATGSQKGVIEENDRAMQIQTELLKKIKENKAQGKDTSRLQKALNDLTASIGTTGSQVTDIGTGGITNKEVLKSAGSLASLPAMAYLGSIRPGTTALPSFKFGSKIDLIANAPAIKTGLKAIGITPKLFNTFTAADKIEALANIASKAGVVDKGVILQKIALLEPQAIKAAGGAVKFAELYPTAAKVLGLVPTVLKGAGGLALTGTGVDYFTGGLIQKALGLKK